MKPLVVEAGDKVELTDPIAGVKMTGVVATVTEDRLFYEINLDTKRTKVLERSEFHRFGLRLLPKDEVTVGDIDKFKEDTAVTVRKKVTTTWKKFELTVAEFFDTTRNPLSGAVKTVTNSDTLHKKIYIECKYRDSLWYFDPLTEARETEGKPVVYVICNLATYKGGDLWLCYMDDFKWLCKEVTYVKAETGQGRLISSNSFVRNRMNKYGSLLSLYQQTEDRAKIEGKIPVVAVKMKNRKGYLLGTNPKNFGDLNKLLNKTY